MKTNKPLTKMLLVLVLIVWGLVAFRVYGTMGSGGEDGDGAATGTSAAAPYSPFVYKSDVRDPFHFNRPVRKDSLRNHVALAPKEVWLPPPIKLTGVLLNKTKKKTAVLETADGSVFFLSEGDTLAGAKILKVEKREVSYLFKKKKSQWTLEAE